MRLWNIHPKYLDAKGITAVWREALLAKKVLQGKTTAYKNHPDLNKFKIQKDPVRSINAYLFYIWKESKKRNYKFDKRKLGRTFNYKKIKIPKKRIKQEFEILKNRLKIRDIKKYKEIKNVKKAEPHPLIRC